MRTARLAGIIVLWTLQVLLAAAFIVIGMAKFGDPAWAGKFARWGYPDGFYMVIGTLEVLGGLTLVIPRVASYGTALLGVVMLGASLTHFVHGESNRVVPPLMFLAVLAIVGIARRRQAVLPASMRPAAPELGRM
jgi:putative oxidoreductase